MKTSFFLKEPGKVSSPVFARISWNGNTLKVYPGESINTEFWDKATQRARQSKKFPAYPEFNHRLNQIQTMIETIYRQHKNDNLQQEPTPVELKVLIDAVLRPGRITKDEKPTFLKYFAQFIERSKDGSRIKKGQAAKGTVHNTNKGYLTTLRHLETFARDYRKFDFETVDLEFYNDYTKYLTQKAKLSANTIGDHIKRIKSVLHDATANGIETNRAFTSPYFNRIKEQTDSIYLTEAEIQAITNLDLSGNKRLEQVRDLFLIGCYTGQRFSDWGKVTPQQVKAGLIEITQQKTDNRVTIPLHPVVKKLFSKYDGILPRPLSNQKFNEYLKEVARLVPELQDTFSKTQTKAGKKVTTNFEKWQLVTTHTARRTFATLEYLAGTPTATIMAVTGHKTAAAFMAYLKLSQTEHAKLLQLHWDKRNLKAV